jgi:hypothetical protein
MKFIETLKSMGYELTVIDDEEEVEPVNVSTTNNDTEEDDLTDFDAFDIDAFNQVIRKEKTNNEDND